MKVHLMVKVNGQYSSGGACIEVPDIQLECFEPLRTCDDVLLCMATQEIPAESACARKVIKTRDDAAKKLADELASIIVHEMKKNDTHNGYPVAE